MYRRVDIIGGVGACVGGAGLAWIGYSSGESGTLEIGLAALVASTIYLLFRSRITSSSNPSLPSTMSVPFILTTVFFCAFAVSIYVMHSSMYRPPLYFVLTCVSVAAVAAHILRCSGKTQTRLLLLEILLISFSLRYGLLYELPGLYGNDPWGHAIIVKAWLSEGHITGFYDPGVPSAYTAYVTLPFMHLNVMATQLVDSLGPKDSFFLSIGLFYVASTLFVFLLGQHLVDTNAGLLAALLISVNQFHIVWGAWLIPTSLGIGIFSMVSYLILKRGATISNTAILLCMCMVLVFTHTVSSFVTAIVLLLFLIATILSKSEYGTHIEKTNIRSTLVILFWAAMLGHWMYCFSTGSSPFFVSKLGWFIQALTVDAQYVGTPFEASATPLGPLNRVGFLMFVGFIVIGALCWLSPKAICSKKLAVVAATLALSVVTFVFPFFNIENMIPGRWLPFIAVIGAPIAAEGILALARLFNGRVVKSLLMVLIVFVFSMFMINSSGINTRTPFYGKDYMQDPARNAYTESEMCAVETTAEICDGQITTDDDYRQHPFLALLGLDESKRVKSLSVEGENEGLIVIREYMYGHQLIGECSQEQYHDFLATFAGSRYDMIYMSQTVKAYFRR